MKLVKIVNKSGNELPEYKTPGSSGMDLRAFLEEPVVLWSGQRTLIPTGLYVEIPDGFELQIRPRSGLALRHGIVVLNSPGTIDSDYRGEIGVILANFSNEHFTINNGDRIAQAVMSSYEQVDWMLVDKLGDTNARGNGGFGSTGIK